MNEEEFSDSSFSACTFSVAARLGGDARDRLAAGRQRVLALRESVVTIGSWLKPSSSKR
ncbi:MAG: hypothetical protein ACFFA7_18725 [Promethearchaeota archaeon]